MINGYIQHTCTVPPPSRSPHIILHPPPSAVPKVSMLQTSHPDPDNCSNIYSMRATTHGAHSSQQSPSTTLTCMLRTSFKRGAQRLPSLSGIPASTNKKSYWYVRRRAAHFREQIHAGCSRLLRPQNISRSHTSQTPQPGARRLTPILGLILRWRSADKTESKMSLHLFKRAAKLCATENENKSAVCDKVMIGDSQPCEKRARASTKPLAHATRNPL
jgi:hypothetical protein